MDETKLKNPETNEPLDIEPINICKPAEVKRNDQIYVIQYPLGGNLSLSASQCFVVGKDNQIACMIMGGLYFNNIVKLVFDGYRYPKRITSTIYYTGCFYYKMEKYHVYI